MKTKSFIGKGTADLRKWGGDRKGASGFVLKVTLVVLVLGVLAGAGFVLLAKGRALPKGALPNWSQESSTSPAVEAPAVAAGTPDPGEIPTAAPAVSPAAAVNMPPAPAKAVSPAGPKIAPAGMVYLAKRITITKETGIASFPRGTLVIVKSKEGGKIRGSIRGMVVELSEEETASVLQD